MAQRKKSAARRGRAVARSKVREPAKSVRRKSEKRTRAKISPESWGATMGSTEGPHLQRPVDRLRDLITADRASTANPKLIGPRTKRHSLRPPSP
jgi:hypothetical protein